MANKNTRQIRLHDATQGAAPFKTNACMILNLQQLTIRDQGHAHLVLDPISFDSHFYINESLLLSIAKLTWCPFDGLLREPLNLTRVLQFI